MNSPEWRKKALRMDFIMRIWLGKHVAERKNEVVQVPMIVELALIVIKRGIRALRISVQNPARPTLCQVGSPGARVLVQSRPALTSVEGSMETRGAYTAALTSL